MNQLIHNFSIFSKSTCEILRQNGIEGNEVRDDKFEINNWQNGSGNDVDIISNASVRPSQVQGPSVTECELFSLHSFLDKLLVFGLMFAGVPGNRCSWINANNLNLSVFYADGATVLISVYFMKYLSKTKFDFKLYKI